MADLSLTEYVKVLEKNSKPTPNLLIGSFYSFRYYFDQETKHSVKRFYDQYPLVFIFDAKQDQDKNKLFIGLNFHHLPMYAREIWFDRLTKMYPNFEGSRRRYQDIDYQRLFLMFKKSVFAVRQYRMERIKRLRKIEPNKIKGLLDVGARTHFGTILDEVENRYKKYIPPKRL